MTCHSLLIKGSKKPQSIIPLPPPTPHPHPWTKASCDPFYPYRQCTCGQVSRAQSRQKVIVRPGEEKTGAWPETSCSWFFPWIPAFFSFSLSPCAHRGEFQDVQTRKSCLLWGTVKRGKSGLFSGPPWCQGRWKGDKISGECWRAPTVCAGTPGSSATPLHSCFLFQLKASLLVLREGGVLCDSGTRNVCTVFRECRGSQCLLCSDYLYLQCIN